MITTRELCRALASFGTGNAQGALSLCTDPGAQLSQNTASAEEDNDDGGKETTEVVRDVFIILLVGVAAVGGLVLLTYLSALISDQYCCCFPWFRPVSNAEEYNASFDRGAVARKARLWGLTLEERARILTAFFEKRIFLFVPKTIPSKETKGERQQLEDEAVVTENVPLDEGSEDFPASAKATVKKETDVETGDSKKTESEKADADVGNNDEVKGTGNWLGDALKSLSPSNDEENDKRDGEAEGKDEENKEKKDGEEEEDEDKALDDADHERICCICLNEYEQDDKLITGTQCIHQFHYTCCMEWLGKNDHCPYCRQEMLTATQMRQAAIETLGRDRVQELGAPAAETPTRARLPSQAASSAAPADEDNNNNNNAQTSEGDVEMGRTGQTTAAATTTANNETTTG